MKIIDNRTVKDIPVFSIGDWVEITQSNGRKFLCLIAQTEPGLAKLISIDTDANRYDDETYELSGYIIAAKFVEDIQKEGGTVTKLNVTLTINNV